jgi:hypothetical protein
MQPIAWLHDYTAPNGTTKGRSFCTTMGASVDYQDENLRRLIVNAAHHLLGLPVPEKADVAFIDPFNPTFYGFIKNADYFKQRNLKPGDFATGSSPSMGLPEDNQSRCSPKRAPRRKRKTNNLRVRRISPRRGSRRHHGTQSKRRAAGEGRAHRAHRQRPRRARCVVQPHRDGAAPALSRPDLFFRNMGHVGDTPGFRPHPSRVSQWAFPGAEKFHPDKTIHNGKGFYPTPDQWLTHLKADTIVGFFGYNESFDGPSKVGTSRRNSTPGCSTR